MCVGIQLYRKVPRTNCRPKEINEAGSGGETLGRAETLNVWTFPIPHFYVSPNCGACVLCLELCCSQHYYGRIRSQASLL